MAVPAGWEPLAESLLRTGLGLPDHDTLDAALALLTGLADAALPGTAGCSVALTRDGSLVPVASTGRVAWLMDAAQFSSGRGPCLDAVRREESIRVDVASEDARYPELARRGRETGVESVLSVPLQLPAGAEGSFNVYSTRRSHYTDGVLDAAVGAFAELAARLVAAADRAQVDDLGARLQLALGDRTIVAQAQGMVMAGEGMSARESLSWLIGTARSREHTVLEVAESVIASVRRDPDAQEAAGT